MSRELERYVRPVREGELARLLDDPAAVETEPIGTEADLAEVREVFEGVLEEYPQLRGAERAVLDRTLAEPLHRALAHLTPRQASDMGFWHWLCIAGLPDVVSWRWYGAATIPGEALEKRALAERFLGAGTLRGISRNALARLWWCAGSLHTGEDGYALAREVLAKQDLFQAIFERDFGLYPPAARACVRYFGNASEGEWRRGTLRLNHYLTTIVLETLSEDDVLELLSG